MRFSKLCAARSAAGIGVVTLLVGGLIPTLNAGSAVADDGDGASQMLQGQAVVSSGSAQSTVKLLAFDPLDGPNTSPGGVTEIGSSTSDAVGRFGISANSTAVAAYEARNNSPADIFVNILTYAPDGHFSVFATTLQNTNGANSSAPMRTFAATATTSDDSSDTYTGTFQDDTAALSSKMRKLDTPPADSDDGPEMEKGRLIMPLTMKDTPAETALARKMVRKLAPRTGVKAADAPISPYGTSQRFKVADYGDRSAIIGDMASSTGASGWKGDWTYNTTSHSTVEVDFSAGNKNSDFSQGGTQTVTSTVSIPYPDFASPGRRFFRTHFHYSKYHVVYSAGGSTFGYYEPLADRFDGGNPSENTASPAYSHCTTYYGAGYSRPFSRTSSSATTWTNAITVAGLKLSAKTGYSGTAHVEYYIATGNTQLICGSRGQFSSSPGSTEIRGS